MASIQSILDDIKLRYRHTFTTDQVLVWMNEEQRELFETLQMDSVPYSFPLIAGQNLYPIPDGVEKDRIKVVTIQIDAAATPDYVELPFIENDNNMYVNADDYWYSLLEGNYYINTPGPPVDGRLVYIYLDQQPTDMSSTAVNAEPSVPIRYQEILKLGTLKRIALARKDTDWANNFSALHDERLLELEWKMQTQQPEFHSAVDVLPKRSRYRTGRIVQYVTINTGP